MFKYEYDKYVTDSDGVYDTVKKYGVAIIPKVLNKKECKNMVNGMWDYLESVTRRFETPIDRDDEDTWHEMRHLAPLHSMLIQRWEVGHAQFVWDLRQNRKVIEPFTKIWDVKARDLLVSFDGSSFHLPVEGKGYFKKHKLHVDQNFNRKGFECIQSWVTALDVNEGDASLCFLEGSNKYHDRIDTDKKGDFIILDEDELEYYKKKGCKKRAIKCPAGSMVFWDSRTVHAGKEPDRDREENNIRCVSYICYTPRKFAIKTKKNGDKSYVVLDRRIKAFEEMRTTNHWPHKPLMFPVMPRTYGKPPKELSLIRPIKEPEINELGERLVGYY